MRHRNRPFALANSIFEIEPSFYRSLGITTVLVDLDNTLDPYTVSDPTERTIKWKESLIALGLRIVILSNNSGKRVRRYAEKLGVECRCFMRKPFSGPLKKFLAEEKLEKNEVVLIGDQIQTDVKAANGAGIRVILTEPLDPQEPPWTKFNRIFDKPKREKIFKRKLAPHWKEILNEQA